MQNVRLLLLLVLLILSSCQQDSLVRSGKTGYAICLSADPYPETVQAAGLLQKYVRKMSHATLPIDSSGRVLQPNTIDILVDTALHSDGFRIIPGEHRLTVLGGAHKGCIYGVVQLLEWWGCRKYAPDYELIPHHSTLRLPENEMADQPVNDYRIINGDFCRDRGYQNWQRLDLINDRFAKGYYVHTFQRLLPWKEYFHDHPEYFALVNGKRIIDQPCLSNPDVLKIVIDKLEQEMAVQPGKLLWSVSQNDNFSYCQCDKCRKIIEEEGSPAGPVIRFVNEVARHFPDKTISTLAYQYSRKAPAVTRPESNVQVMLCTIELNRSKPIADDPTSRSFVRDIREWGRITPNIYLWDYTVDFAHQVSPFPNIHVLQPNIQFFVANGVRQHFQQSNTGNGHTFSELKSYLISRLLWDTQVNADSVINDFMTGYYGSAAPYIRDYLDAIEGEVQKTGEWLDIYAPPTAYENTFLSEENIHHYLDLFSKALKRVKRDSARLIHVKTALLPVQYAAMEIGKNHMFEARGWYYGKTEKQRPETKGEKFVVRPEMAEMLEQFYETCREAGVHSLNEAGLTPQDYYYATKRFINVAVEGNRAFRKPVSAQPLPAAKYSGGDLAYLTNGVRGAADYKVHWLGWEARDFTLTLDEKTVIQADTIEISTLYDPKSWIFHPVSVVCSIASDSTGFLPLDTILVQGDQHKEPVIRTYTFDPHGHPFRFVRFNIQGTLQNPDWHPSAGGKSWVFVDEIVVR